MTNKQYILIHGGLKQYGDQCAYGCGRVNNHICRIKEHGMIHYESKSTVMSTAVDIKTDSQHINDTRAFGYL
jgi:hypothetical protein